MTLTKKRRATLIKKLINDLLADGDNIRSMLREVLREGHMGFTNYLDEELLEAYREAFGKDFLPKS